MAETTYAKGLEGVIAAESDICQIDGANGKLYYRGYSIEDLAEHSSFEETTFLLLNEKLPSKAELDDFSHRMRQSRRSGRTGSGYDPPVSGRRLARWNCCNRSSPISAAPWSTRSSTPPPATAAETLHQIAQIARRVGRLPAVPRGQSPIVEPKADLSARRQLPLHAARRGAFGPRKATSSIRASCCTPSTVSTHRPSLPASSPPPIRRAIAASRRPSGAGRLPARRGQRAASWTWSTRSARSRTSSRWLDKALDKHRKVMGMGHRVYKAKDPRSIIMEKMLQQLCEQKGDTTVYDMLKEVERVFRDRMEEKGKPIYPNVDFFSGAVYALLGIPARSFHADLRSRPLGRLAGPYPRATQGQPPVPPQVLVCGARTTTLRTHSEASGQLSRGIFAWSPMIRVAAEVRPKWHNDSCPKV